ncbi:DDE-type integrase/transposase/recombinase [Pseudodesulfovibrio sp.]|uniref:DDE-type integrase/transposase/recombinase n=1 Tax=Pseudodesulfovibrio sp. TaxID=2035812 RepID=UPI002601E2B3|nr:DDE-type integrase/transposase/recombinase [Pseudodesulfovibrio sp.]MDD3310982.1 DDE-type integrase/transposase/recombinase [Pseudodesulfovibrio sp.]
MTTDLGTLDTLRNLAASLDGTAHGARKPLVEDAARLLNCSEQTVYRWLKDQVGWTSGRKRRSNSGQSSVSEETCLAVAHLTHKGTRANGKRIMSLSDATAMVAASGFADANVSPSTISRAMRQYRCHPAMLAQGKPYTSMRSLHPNHVWQVDPSMCVLFYLPKGGLAVAEESKFYKNKLDNYRKAEKGRVWRYVITDHYSGTIYVRYVQAAGESAQGLIDVFLDAISDRGRHDPMHGVPDRLYMDKGSANTARLFTNLLDRLSVKWDTHKAGNPRAKGQVECGNNIVETKFESRLTFLRVGSVEELQTQANRWCQHYNAFSKHTRTGRTRNEVWLTITEDQLRLAPPLALCRELVTTQPKDVQIKGDMTISHAVKGYGRHRYDLRTLPGLVPQMHVDVVVNPYRAPAIDVVVHDPSLPEDLVWTVEPIVTNEVGFRTDAPVWGQEYQAQPDTLADKRVKAIDEAAGVDAKHPNAPAGVDVMADIRPAPEYLPRRGRDLGLDASRRELAPYKTVEAAMQLKGRLGDQWTGEAYAWLMQRYPEGVPVEDLDKIVERFQGRKAPAPLKLVVNGE